MAYQGLTSRAVPYSIWDRRRAPVIEMRATKKITVLVSAETLAKAQKAAQAGVSGTVRKGLELLAASDAYYQLWKMRGKVKFSVDLKELRQDR